MHLTVHRFDHPHTADETCTGRVMDAQGNLEFGERNPARVPAMNRAECNRSVRMVSPQPIDTDKG